MSEEGAFWAKLAEKFFGLILALLGIITIYYTFTSTSALGAFTGFFGFLAIVLLTLGIVLILAKPE